VLNHVLLHQTVIGQEALAQMAMAGDEPDVVIACVGGGSNFGGLAIPFLRRVIRDGAKTRFIAAEPAACPTLSRGVYAYDFARAEGTIPAPEPAHAIRAVIEDAMAAREAGEPRVILFGLCGHGHFDLSAYDAYLSGKLEDPEFSEDDMNAALASLPAAPALT
jgi:tryptophan synthase beta chain